MLYALACSFVLFSSESFARPGEALRSHPGLQDYSRSRQALAMYYRQLAQKRKTLDTSDFDAKTLATRIGPDVTALFHFVRDKIAYQAYAGVLRMPPGTLMSSAGNAFDQSLLLAALLRAAGYTARFATGHLNRQQLDELISSGGRRPAATVPNLERRLESLDRSGLPGEQLTTIRRNLRAGLRSFVATLDTGLNQDVALLSEQLQHGGIDLADRAEPNALASLDVNHCWVQVAIDGQWRDLDPSFARSEIGQRWTEAQRVVDDLDTGALSYRMQLVIDVEKTGPQGDHGTTVLDQTVPLTSTVDRITVLLTPQLEKPGAAALADDPGMLDRFDTVWPSITVNGQAVPGQPFDLSGDAVSTDADIKRAESVRKPVSSGFGALEKALGGLDSKAPPKTAPASHLSRVTLTVRLLKPDGTGKSLTRVLARRHEQQDGSEMQIESDLRSQFVSSLEIMASGGRITNAYIEARYLDHELANRSAHFLALGYVYDQPPSNQREILDHALSVYPFALLEYLYTRYSLLESVTLAKDAPLSAYAAEPQVVAMQQRAAVRQGEPVVVKQYDVMFNHLAISEPPSSAADPLRRAQLRLRQGVLDTLLEYEMLGGGDVVNAHSVTAAAAQEGIPLVWLDPEGVDSLSLADDTREAIQRDLDKGYRVLAPARPPTLSGRKTFAWWRVDPSSGETLGMGGDGQGQATTEYAGINFAQLTEMSAVFCAFFQAVGLGGRGLAEMGKCIVTGIAVGAAGSVLVPRIGMGAFLAAFCALQNAFAGSGGAAARAGQFVECIVVGVAVSIAGGAYAKARWGGGAGGARPVEETAAGETPGPRVEEFDPTAPEEGAPESTTSEPAVSDEGPVEVEEFDPTASDEGPVEVEEFDPTASDEGPVEVEEFDPTASDEGPVEVEEFDPTSSDEGPVEVEEFDPTASDEGPVEVEEFDPTASDEGPVEVEEFDPTASEEGQTSEFDYEAYQREYLEAQQEANRLRAEGEAELQVRREQAPRFVREDGTPLRNPNVGELVEGDTARVRTLMRGYGSSQTDIYEGTVNQIARDMINGNFRWQEMIDSGDLIEFGGKKGNIVTHGHHRVVAARLASEATGRPIRGGDNPIIPDEAIAPTRTSESQIDRFDVTVHADEKPSN